MRGKRAMDAYHHGFALNYSGRVVCNMGEDVAISTVQYSTVLYETAQRDWSAQRTLVGESLEIYNVLSC